LHNSLLNKPIRRKRAKPITVYPSFGQAIVCLIKKKIGKLVVAKRGADEHVKQNVVGQSLCTGVCELRI